MARGCGHADLGPRLAGPDQGRQIGLKILNIGAVFFVQDHQIDE